MGWPSWPEPQVGGDDHVISRLFRIKMRAGEHCPFLYPRALQGASCMATAECGINNLAWQGFHWYRQYIVSQTRIYRHAQVLFNVHFTFLQEQIEVEITYLKIRRLYIPNKIILFLSMSLYSELEPYHCISSDGNLFAPSLCLKLLIVKYNVNEISVLLCVCLCLCGSGCVCTQCPSPSVLWTVDSHRVAGSLSQTHQAFAHHAAVTGTAKLNIIIYLTALTSKLTGWATCLANLLTEEKKVVGTSLYTSR